MILLQKKKISLKEFGVNSILLDPDHCDIYCGMMH